MPRPKKKSERELQLEKELAAYKQVVELNALGAGRTGAATRALGELWVGVRNISDLTVGVRSPFPNEADLHLHADYGKQDPNSVAVVSYAWWLQLRRHKVVAEGMVIRDDRIMGSSFVPGPEDRPEDLPAEAAVNQIEDPKGWIDSRDEAGIRAGIAAFTAQAPLYRLRRVVDEAIREQQDRYPPEDKERTTKAYQAIPAVYHLVDTLTTQKLEAAFTA